MRSFYAPSKPMPLDQADGLRRMFAGRRCQVLALVANPHVPFGGLVLDRLASVMAAQGRQVLVVDAASTSPPPHELAAVDLSACIEPVAPGVRYLPAKGLPLNYVDTRGFGGAFIDAVQLAAQQSGQAADVVLLHADAADLARLFKPSAAQRHDPSAQHPTVRPVLLGADHPESIKHAYANAKLLAQRCGFVQHDLILVSAPHSPRVSSISHSLADCVERFLDGSIGHIALIDPAVTVVSARAAQLQRQTADADLQRLIRAQLQDDDDHEAQALSHASSHASSHPPSHAAVRAAARMPFGTPTSRDAQQPTHSISSTAF